MMLRMYQRWAERRGFDVEIDEVTRARRPGILSATFIVKGRYAYGLLDGERGVHRLVRISPFDSPGPPPDRLRRRRCVPVRSRTRRASRDRREGPPHRHLPVVGRRRPARQHDRLGGPHHPPADRHRRHLPERAQPAPEQGQGHADPGRQAGRAAAPGAQQAELERLAGGKRAESRGAARSAPTFSRPYQLVKDLRTEHETGNVQAVLDGDLDAFMEAYLAGGERRAWRANCNAPER